MTGTGRWPDRRGAAVWGGRQAKGARLSSPGTTGKPSILNEVTERKAEAELRRAVSLLQATLDATADGLLVIDPQGRIVSFNQRFIQMWGVPQEVLESRDDGQALAYAVNQLREPDEFMRKVRELYAHPEAESFDVLHFRDGRVFERYSMPQRLDGRAVGRVWSFRDVTDRRRAESALRESEERYRSLVEVSPDVIAVHSEGRLVFMNSAGARLFGYPQPDDLLGRPVLDLVHPESRERVAARMRLTAQGLPVPFEQILFARKDGSPLSLEVAAVPFTFHDRPAVQVVARDVSERKRAEKLQAALYRISQVSGSAEDMAECYAALRDIVGGLMCTRNFYIALYDDDSDTLSFPCFVDEVDPPPGPKRPGRGLTEYVLRHGRPLLCRPSTRAELEAAGEVQGIGTPSLDWLGVPLKRGDKTFGVLAVQSYDPAAPYGETELGLLTFVSQHVAAAIDRQRSADALRESEARFRTLAETAPCAIFIYRGSSFAYANAFMAGLTGYSREELSAMSFWQVIHRDFRDLVRRRVLPQPRDAAPANHEIKVVRKDGQERWVDFSASLIEFEGRPAALGTAFDITQRKRSEEQIRTLAYHDVLTGLPNRLLFNDRLTVAVAQAHRHGQRLGVLFLDVDRFKVINDSLGHSLGDRLLQGVADRLMDCVREGDTVARLGGDEFTLLLPGLVQPTDVGRIAEKILEAIKLPFRLDGRDLYVTASMGISLYPEDGRDAETLVKNADTAMYRAKEQGRDNYQLYTPAMNATAVERLSLESDLRGAVARGELELHYQPVLEMASRRVHGVEALLRWRHGGRGLLPPAEFVPLAELTGLIVPMSPWILRTACAQARAWQAEGLPARHVAVNLSARQLQQGDIVETVRAALLETGLPPGSLDVEVTESNAMQNAEATIVTLRQLKALGVGVSIDDFGIGYSSLNYLRRLPIDTLKIDQSFVRDITTDPDDAAIATAVIALAHTLKLRVVAEGVETPEQLAFLAERQCDRMQGYLISHPLAPQDCRDFLRSHS